MTPLASGAILIVPAVEQGRGGGHLRRSSALAEAIRSLGGEAWLYAGPPPEFPAGSAESAESRREVFFAGCAPPEWWIDSKTLAEKTWSLVVLDKFRSSPAALRRWSALAPTLGIDEGQARGDCDFLIDLLPGLPGRESPNLCAPSLLPLPSRRRTSFFRGPGEPVRVLVSFGAEDAAGLTLTAGAFSARPGGAFTQPDGENSRTARGFSLTAVLGPLYRRREESRPALEKAGFTVIDGEDLPPGRDGSPDLREILADCDLLVTHFGITAFQALHARLPVLLFNPGPYHERLARAAGLPSAGVGKRAAARLWDCVRGLEMLARQSEIAAHRWGLDEAANSSRGLAEMLLEAAPRVYRVCPLCGKQAAGKAAARFPHRTYRRCSCGAFYMSRLNPPPVEYNKDYFFEEYRKQYGKTYLEDFPLLKKAGERRLAHIRALLPSLPPGPSPRPSPHIRRNSPNVREAAFICDSPNVRDTAFICDSPNVQEAVLKRTSPNVSDTQDTPRLLDLGCAYGPFLAAAREGGFDVLGQDPVEEAVAYVGEQLGIAAVRGSFPGDAAELAALAKKNGGFDVISLWYVMEHFEEPGRALAAINGLLKTGGVLAFSTPSAAGISRRKSLRTFLERSPADHWTIWDPRRCKAILRRCGFRLKKIVITGRHPERFPLPGFLLALKPVLLFCAVLCRIFSLGDTFEAYAVKITDKTFPADIQTSNQTSFVSMERIEKIEEKEETGVRAERCGGVYG